MRRCLDSALGSSISRRVFLMLAASGECEAAVCVQTHVWNSLKADRRPDGRFMAVLTSLGTDVSLLNFPLWSCVSDVAWAHNEQLGVEVFFCSLLNSF